MRFFIANFLLISIYVLPLSVLGQWKHVKTKDDVRFYNRPYKGTKAKEIRAVTTVDASLSSLVAVIKDSEIGTEWINRMRVFRTVREVNNMEWYTYAEADLPLPYYNRDLVTKNRLVQSAKSKVVTVYLISTPEELEEKDGIVRIKEAEGFWRFIPLEDGKTKIVYQFYSEPQIGLPAWIKDPLIANGIIGTLRRLRKQAKKEKYKNKKFPYIRD